MMFARFFKRSPITTVFALLLVFGLTACGSTQPTVEVLHKQGSTALEMGMPPLTEQSQSDALVAVSPSESIALDQYPKSQALIARMFDVNADIVLAMEPSGKVQAAALALCLSFRGGGAVDPDQLRDAADQIANVYSTEVSDASRRFNDSMQHLNRLVDEACETESRGKW